MNEKMVELGRLRNLLVEIKEAYQLSFDRMARGIGVSSYFLRQKMYGQRNGDKFFHISKAEGLKNFLGDYGVRFNVLRGKVVLEPPGSPETVVLNKVLAGIDSGEITGVSAELVCEITRSVIGRDAK